MTSIERLGPELWDARGVGLGYGAGVCWVTGETIGLGPDLSGFVRSKDAGERVVEMFGGRAALDFRPDEPHWIQVKVAVRADLRPVLVRLCDMANACDGVITGKSLSWVLDPEGLPGWKPRAVAFAEQLSEARRLVA